MIKELLFILVLMLIPIVSADSVVLDGFNVTWYDCKYGVLESSCKVDIQNLGTSNRAFDLSVIISDTNYDLLSTQTISSIKEWKALPTTVTEIVQVPFNYSYETSSYDNDTHTFTNNTVYATGYYPQQTSVTKNINGWKESKSYMFNSGSTKKMNYGSINIPKFNSAPKYDDYGSIETSNGIKKFIVTWTTPVLKTSSGYGSIGKIAFFNELSGYEYHPWWNSSWAYRVSSAISNGTRPLQMSVNVSNSSGTNNATHIYCGGNCNADFSDIRFTLENTTELSYWIISGGNGLVYVNVTGNGTVNMYYGNSTITTTSDSTNFWANGTGGAITNIANNYRVHTWTINGSFQGFQYGWFETVLVGGGAGGGAGGGGGGAGGLINNSSAILTTTSNLSVTVGSGGAGAPAGTCTNFGSNGSSSVITSLFTALGGGAGGGYSSPDGLQRGHDGGSGGGGSQAYGNGTLGQGKNGGTGTRGGTYLYGGGGGNLTQGINASTMNGGNGSLININGTASMLSAGGGGGKDASGAGGQGGDYLYAIAGNGNGGTTAGTSAKVNTGSGGGGGGSGGTCGAGGAGSSGIIFLRYHNTNTSVWATWGAQMTNSGTNSTPPTPVLDTVTIGNFWKNITVTAGAGNITDFINVSRNGTWYNGSNFFFNSTTIPHGWMNDTIYAFNISGIGSLSVTPLTNNTQVPNNVPVMDALTSQSIVQNALLTFTVSATDIDGDTQTYSTNATKGTLNATTGVYSWTPTSGDVGTYIWSFTTSDGYGGTDTEVITVTVSEHVALNNITLSSEAIFRCQQSVIQLNLNNYTSVEMVRLALDLVYGGMSGGSAQARHEEYNMTNDSNGNWSYVYGNNQTLTYGKKTITISILEITSAVVNYTISNKSITVYSDACVGSNIGGYQNLSNHNLGTYTAMLFDTNINFLDWMLIPWTERFGTLFYFLVMIIITISVYMKSQNIVQPTIALILLLVGAYGANLVPTDLQQWILLLVAIGISVMYYKIFVKKG